MNIKVVINRLREHNNTLSLRKYNKNITSDSFTLNLFSTVKCLTLQQVVVRIFAWVFYEAFLDFYLFNLYWFLLKLYFLFNIKKTILIFLSVFYNFQEVFKDLGRTFQKYLLLLLDKKTKNLGEDLTFYSIYILSILTVKIHMKL